MPPNKSNQVNTEYPRGMSDNMPVIIEPILQSDWFLSCNNIKDIIQIYNPHIKGHII